MEETVPLSPTVPISPARARFRPRRSHHRQQCFTLLLVILTALTMSFTVFFAYNSSLPEPISRNLIFAKPERSILVLNLASQITIFCLAELTSSVLEVLRWALACTVHGVSAHTFLVLGRSTNVVGVLFLLCGRGAKAKASVQRDSHRLWGSQRLLFILIRCALGVILLSDVSFQSTYSPAHQVPVTSAGLAGAMNTALVGTPAFNLTATAQFWWYYPALLTDGQNSRAVTPINCTGDTCNSFFLPGPMAVIEFDPSQPVVTADQYPVATAYIQNDAPGYQIDFEPIDYEHDPPMTLDDCKVFGTNTIAVQVCLKKVNSSFLAGTSTADDRLISAWNSCPFDVSDALSCLNTSDWRTVDPFNTKFTISERRASTVFDRSNFTILDIIDFSDPLPTPHTPADYFLFYEVIFAVDTSVDHYNQTVQYLFLDIVSSYLRNEVNSQIDINEHLLKLQEFLATPVAIFNNIMWDIPTPNLGQSITLATPSYRLIIAPYTLYSFIVGGYLSLLWCLLALSFSLFVRTPNSSLFPEINFASKAMAETNCYNAAEHSPLAKLLSPLSNTGSIAILKRLSLKRFFVRYPGYATIKDEETQDIVIALQEKGFMMSGKAVRI